MNDYVILFDENGQPYIEHSVWSKARDAASSGRKKATKYIEKIGEGAKARYFYTKQELDAYYNKGKQKAKQTVDKAKQKAKDWSGVTARENMKSASNAMRRAHVTNKRDYSNERAARREAMRKSNDLTSANSARAAADQTAKEAVRTARTLGAINSDANKNLRAAEKEAELARVTYKGAAQTNYVANQQAKAATDKWYDDEVSLGKKVQRALRKGEQNAHNADLEAAQRAQKKSNDSLFDKRNAERELKKSEERLEGEKAKAERTNADYERAVEAERRAMSEKRMADKEAEKAERDYKVASGKYSELHRKVLDSDVAYLKAEVAYLNAKDEYANTPLGKIDTAKQKVKEARKAVNAYASDKLGDIKDWASDRAESAKEKAKELAGSAKEKAGQAADKAKDLASSAKEKAGQVADKAKDVATSAADKAKGAAGSVADKAKGTVSSVKSSYERMKDDFAASKVDKEVKKAESDFRNFKSKYKAPDAGVFSFDTASGTTVRNKERYDYYTNQAEDTFAYINNNPNLSTSAKQQLLSEAQEYMEYAQKYAWKK